MVEIVRDDPSSTPGVEFIQNMLDRLFFGNGVELNAMQSNLRKIGCLIAGSTGLSAASGTWIPSCSRFVELNGEPLARRLASCWHHLVLFA